MIKDKSCLFKDIIEDMKNIYLEFGDEKLIEDDDWCVYTLSKKSSSQILNAMSLIILIMTMKQEKKFFLNMLLSIR